MRNALLVAGLLLLLPLSAHSESAPSPEGLALGSVHAAVFDLESDQFLYSKYADRPVPIASLTKLMTALVVVESGAPMGAWLTVEERHVEPAANAWSRIRIGSELRRRELLHIAVMASENLAAYTLARQHPGGYDAFIEAMNAKAAELGMSDSRFVDPSGLSTGNVSTARDLVRLLKATRRHEAIVDASSQAGYIARFRSPRYNLRYGNTNVLVHRRWDIDVSKTGYLDDAGRCLALVVDLEGSPRAVVLLDSVGTRTPIGDVGRIRRWLATGESGPVAVGARNYEAERSARYSDSMQAETH